MSAVLERLRQTPRDPLLVADLEEVLASAPTGADSSRGWAVYALGCLWLQKVKEAETARKFLLERFPDAAEARILADWDELFRPCPWCGGTGSRLGPVCERCKGARRCTACEGAGKVTLMGGRKAPCPACSGSGRCQACAGKGRTMEKCPRCEGRRRLPLPESAFRLYRALLRAQEENEL